MRANYYRYIPALLLAIGLFSLDIVPAEDAHIAFRYAENLADGHGLVFNPGERVEGATSTLWTLAMAGAHALTLDVPRTAVMLALLLLGWLVFSYWELPETRVVVAGSPLVITALSGFETVAAALALLLLVKQATATHRDRRHWLAPVLAAAVGLLRPEGWVVAAAVLAIGTAAAENRSKWWLRYGIFAGVLMLQLLLRYVYYGDLLPATFYAKAGGSLRWDGLQNTLYYYVPVLVLLVVPWLMGKRELNRPQTSPDWQLRWGLTLAVLLAFPLAYMFMHQSQNIGLRFQFWLLPATLCAARRAFHSSYIWRQWMSVGVAVLMMIVIWPGQDYQYDDRKAIGERLERYLGSEPLTMAVTEAGWLPYYSGWRTYDLVGLLDSSHAVMDTARLSQINPDLVMYHAYGLDSAYIGGGDPEWRRVVEPVHMWCKRNDYLLVAVYGVPWDNRWYWLRGQPPLSLIIDVATAMPTYLTRINPAKAHTVAQGPK